MRTSTGRLIDPFNLKLDDISIEDIAHHLSNICRFGGATRFHYSVAQHSVSVSGLCSQPHRLHGLLHDASEAYLMDIPRPIKYTEEFASYRQLEAKVQGTIMQRFFITEPEPKEVKDADNQMLELEGIFLMNTRYHIAEPPANMIIPQQTPEEAKASFLETFHWLLITT